MISRRQFLYFSALFFAYCPLSRVESFAAINGKIIQHYPITIDTLKEAYRSEMTANRHYDGYCQKALTENYPNIAYLFYALSTSEKIHADNYQKLIISLGSTLNRINIPVSIADTKTNLNTAAIKELEKINRFYPEILKKLSSESHDEAVINCMYSLKSHQQHEKIILKIKKYSGFFFKLLSKEIENKNPNYYVCEICGSTVDEKPAVPCEICNRPLYHYKQIKRPILLNS